MSEPVSIDEQIKSVVEMQNQVVVKTGLASEILDAILATLRAHQKALAVVREQNLSGDPSLWTIADVLRLLRRLHRAVTGEGD